MNIRGKINRLIDAGKEISFEEGEKILNGDVVEENFVKENVEKPKVAT